MPAHHLQVQWQRPGVSEEDVMVCTFDFAQGVEVFPTSPPNDFVTAEQHLDQWWIDMRALYPDTIVLSGYRWYREDDETPPWGPPHRVTVKNIPGTSTGPSLPPQVAVTVTERTGPPKKHWGRFYLPSPSTDALLQDGRISQPFRDTVAEATRDMYDALSNIGLSGVVRQTFQGLPVRTEISEVAVDDIFDVIRRRRYEVVLERSVRPIIDRTP
jgi:hypothetical protein